MAFAIEPTDALLVVDVQVDFCPGGALAVAGGHEVVPVINALMPRFPTVVLTQDLHPAGHASFASTHGKEEFDAVHLHYGHQVLWPDHCVQGSSGAEFHPDLDRHWAHSIVRKGCNAGVDSYSGFLEADRKTTTGLAGYLRERGVRRVFIAGLATDFCVAWTALDARAAGFDTVLVEGACRAIDLDGSLERALGDLDAAGIARVEAI